MTEFKFACPVCGQHITCAVAKSGTKLDCPTCFQKIIVPQAPADAGGKLLLTAALAQSRPPSREGAVTEAAGFPSRSVTKSPVALIVILICALGAIFVFRDKIFTVSPPDKASDESPTAAVMESAWKADLTGAVIPDTPVVGQISRHVFDSAQAVLEGGTLIFGQGQDGETWRKRLSFSLFASQGEELAGQVIAIEAKHTSPPKVVFSQRDKSNRPARRQTLPSYVLRLQFGELTEGRLPGKIYFCAFDESKSWLSGSFEAEISNALPSKTKLPGPVKHRRLL